MKLPPLFSLYRYHSGWSPMANTALFQTIPVPLCLRNMDIFQKRVAGASVSRADGSQCFHFRVPTGGFLGFGRNPEQHNSTNGLTYTPHRVPKKRLLLPHCGTTPHKNGAFFYAILYVYPALPSAHALHRHIYYSF